MSSITTVRIRIALVGVSAVLGLTLNACSGATAPQSGPSAPAPSSQATGTPSTGAPATGAPTAAPTRSTAATPVAPPSAGTVSETVSARPVVEREPVAFDATAETTAEVTVRVVTAEALQVKASGPGEVGGPGVAFTVEVANRSGHPVSLDLVSPTLTLTGGTPASQMSGLPSAPLQGSLADGNTARGVYVFTASDAQRRDVRFAVSVDPATPTAVFRGRVS